MGVCKFRATSTIVHNTPSPTLSLPTLGSSTRSALVHRFALFGIICKSLFQINKYIVQKIFHVVVTPIWCIFFECGIKQFSYFFIYHFPLTLMETLILSQEHLNQSFFYTQDSSWWSLVRLNRLYCKNLVTPIECFFEVH
jgi:hypothetical protein